MQIPQPIISNKLIFKVSVILQKKVKTIINMVITITYTTKIMKRSK